MSPTGTAEHTKPGAPTRSALVQEAVRLAADGELGNSDAIRLLQIPHRPDEVREVLRTLGQCLSREARSKLTLDALVPPPPGVDSQRYEPIFHKYLITGQTYTTAGGEVVPNELQYYNGEMAHLYGECANVAAVNESLAGSGYRAVTLTHADGRETAVAQLWVSRFTDSTIGPYGAMFIVVAAVGAAPPGQASFRAHPNGASSALAMLDGSFDAATGVYENKARLFLVRLLDTTRVAIDVGRERMGTDKRPGFVDMAREGRRLRLSVEDQDGRGVIRGSLELADDPTAYLSEIAKAAATAGIPFRALPGGTEFCFPGVARIGRGPIVSWQWRSDLVARLQAVLPHAVALDSSSEEGRILGTWGFVPKVLAYVPNVRGLVTGLADPPPRSAGARAVVRAAAPDPQGRGEGLLLLRLARPEGAGEAASRLPVLRLVALEGSRGAARATTAPPEDRRVAAAGPEPRWDWETVFLGSLTAMLRKEAVGVTPDGLRINWHVKTGSFVGPGLQATVLPGAADWMRIRRDGVAIVSVQACFETEDGARVYGSYGGIFDLGPDGYDRAVRDEYPELPPVVVTPTYATADPRLGWLNRAQCVGVGRVDMTALRVEFDVFVVRVGNRIPSPALPASLYSRVGGHDAIVAVTDDFVTAVLADGQLARFFPAVQAPSGLHELKQRVVDLLCQLTGGPCLYTGRDMRTAHAGMGITERDWVIAVDLFRAALDRRTVAPQARHEFVQIIEEMKHQIVEVPRNA